MSDFMRRPWSLSATGRPAARTRRAFRPAPESLEGRIALSSFYASPPGSPAGDGSLVRPWDLATALNAPAILPGDTLWLRGGTYDGAFTSTLAGTPQAPIQVRSATGEHA